MEMLVSKLGSPRSFALSATNQDCRKSFGMSVATQVVTLAESGPDVVWLTIRGHPSAEHVLPATYDLKKSARTSGEKVLWSELVILW